MAASLLHGLSPVAAAAALALLIALSAGLRGRRLAPLWLAVPLFTLVVALPATLNLVTSGPPLLVLWPARVWMTLPGVIVGARFFLRALACLTLALTLTATTEPAALVNALRKLGLPRIFGTVLTMMQRYLVVVLQAAADLHRTKLSRTIGPETLRQGQRWAAAGMGMLLLSSLRLAEGVYNAMIARGFDGDIVALTPPRFGRREIVLVLAALILAAGLVACDRIL